MEDSYSLRIGPVVREVKVVGDIMSRNPIFRVSPIVLRKKLEDISDIDIFRIGSSMGLEQLRASNSCSTHDQFHAREYGFIDSYYENPENKDATKHLWLRINNAPGFIEIEPEMCMVLSKNPGVRDFVKSEEIVGNTSTLMHLVTMYLENRQ